MAPTEPLAVDTLVVGPLQVNCYLLRCTRSGRALVIDPGSEPERILQAARDHGAEIELVVNTHGHFDHIGANGPLLVATGAQLLLHEADRPILGRAREHAALFGLDVLPSPEPDRLLRDGDLLELGELTFRVIHLPGHSPGGIALEGAGHLFSGDALFAGSIGRTDLPGGDHEQLVGAIRSRLLALPDATVVHPGHGPSTTIGREREHNPFVGRGAG